MTGSHPPRTALGWLDSANLLAQVVAKSYGLDFSGRADPPKELTMAGRFAAPPAHPGRWPALRVPLPASAFFATKAESLRTEFEPGHPRITEPAASRRDAIVADGVDRLAHSVRPEAGSSSSGHAKRGTPS